MRLARSSPRPLSFPPVTAPGACRNSKSTQKAGSECSVRAFVDATPVFALQVLGRLAGRHQTPPASTRERAAGQEDRLVARADAMLFNSVTMAWMFARCKPSRSSPCEAALADAIDQLCPASTRIFRWSPICSADHMRREIPYNISRLLLSVLSEGQQSSQLSGDCWRPVTHGPRRPSERWVPLAQHGLRRLRHSCAAPAKAKQSHSKSGFSCFQNAQKKLSVLSLNCRCIQ